MQYTLEVKIQGQDKEDKPMRNGAYTVDGIPVRYFDELAELFVSTQIIRRTATQIVSGKLRTDQLDELESYILCYISERMEKIMALQNEGKLKFYMWQLINRQVNSNTSWFHLHIRQPRAVYTPDLTTDNEQDDYDED